MTRKEKIEAIRKLDLRALSMDMLGSMCQALGLSGRGDRKELTQRIQRELRKEEL